MSRNDVIYYLFLASAICLHTLIARFLLNYAGGIDTSVKQRTELIKKARKKEEVKVEKKEKYLSQDRLSIIFIYRFTP